MASWISLNHFSQIILDLATRARPHRSPKRTRSSGVVEAPAEEGAEEDVGASPVGGEWR